MRNNLICKSSNYYMSIIKNAIYSDRETVTETSQ